MDITIKWKPQDRQLTLLIACGLSEPFEPGYDNFAIADVIGYGGAAGGGKTDGLLMAGFLATTMFPGCKIGYFRREYPQLDGPGGAIMRSQELFSKIAIWNGSQRRWTFPWGGIVQFCHCKSESDVFNYQSQQFDIILVDEATQFTRFMVRYLLTRNRATVKGIKPFAVLATNPGNIGHLWFKDEFVDIGQPERPHEVEVEPGKYETHLFIPSKLSDNRILEERDPGYRKKLENQDENTSKMLLDGNWDVHEGQYFKEWNKNLHVVEPFEIPEYFKKFVSGDYGYSKPSAVLWHAIDEDGVDYVYRELYITEHTFEDLAEKIVEMTPESEKIDYWVFDPSIWAKKDSSVSGADKMKAKYKEITGRNLNLKLAVNDRVIGWTLVRQYLKPIQRQGKITANLQIFSTCQYLIRTLPQLIYDKMNVEDVDSDGEDHAPDSLRYGLMSKPPLAVDIKEFQRKKDLKNFDAFRKDKPLTGSRYLR